MLQLIHNGKKIVVKNDKLITLDSLISMEIGHFKGERLICDIAQRGVEHHYTSFNHELDYDDENELLAAIQAEAMHGNVTIENGGSLFYQPGTEHPGSDMISYTVRSSSGCVGSLAIIIRPEANKMLEEHQYLNGFGDEELDVSSNGMISSIALKITAKDENEVVFVDSFMLDINGIGKGNITLHNQLSSSFEVHDYQDELNLWKFGEDEELKFMAHEFIEEDPILDEEKELSLDDLDDIPYRIYID
ncbi:MAG: hypothetical protein JXQ68_05545 [Campylobacterales bacterium]|nr:hypothetical protein [Campylobacterales bacterium]